MIARIIVAAALAVVIAPAMAGPAASAQDSLLEAEKMYADLLDAQGASSAIKSGLVKQVDGEDQQAWERKLAARRETFADRLRQFDSAPPMTPSDASLLSALRSGFQRFGAQPSPVSSTECAQAMQAGAAAQVLRDALVSCFSQHGDHIAFEGHEMTRVAALQLLQTLEPAARRKQLFLAAAPLWKAVNADGGLDSPYRKLIVATAEDARARSQDSHAELAATALGWSAAELESAVVKVLEAWRRTAVRGAIEPWDYRYQYSGASRSLDTFVNRADVFPVVRRYFADLGADISQLNAAYDIEPRQGKAPFAYTDVIRIGRFVNGSWRPAQVWVSESVEKGGLFTTEELTHETGHVVHLMAIRARPAHFWPDAFFTEAFANVPGWSVHEPAWQSRYLGHSVPRRQGLHERYAGAMLDMCWSLFEIRMLRAPHTDPNRLWTELTSHYLGITPHPELAWWAMRVQLVSDPGYMINYGAGAILTADLRARIAQSIGPFDAGNPQWYPWLSKHLLRFGSQLPANQLLKQFLGRAPSEASLIADLE